MTNKKNPAFIALLLSLGYAMALFDRMGYGVMEPQIASRFGLSVEGAADLGSVFFWAYLVFQIPVGLLADAMGSRRAAITGAALAGIGALETALAPSVFTMAVGRVVCAAGAAFALVAMVRYASLHFADREGAAVGKGLLIGNLGGMAAMGPLAAIVADYQTVWLMIAGLNFALAASVVVWAPEPVGGARSGVFKKAAKEMPMIFASPWTYLGCLMLAGTTGSYYGFCAQAAGRWLFESGVQEGRGWALAASAAGFTAGNYIWGWLSDRVSRRGALLGAVCGALACWGALMSQAGLSAWAVAALYGGIGFFCSPTALIYSLIGNKFSAGLRGGAVGAINCGIPLGAAVGASLSGRLESAQMALPMALFGFAALAALGVSFLLPEERSAAKADAGGEEASPAPQSEAAA